MHGPGSITPTPLPERLPSLYRGTPTSVLVQRHDLALFTMIETKQNSDPNS
jgi:hypothetical protein